MYVMNIYSVKQPQNFIIKVKMKEHEIGKKRIPEKSWMKYIIAFILSVRQLPTCSALFTSEKVVQLTWYKFSTYLYQLQPPSLV